MWRNSDSQYQEWDLIPTPIRPDRVAMQDAASMYWRRRFVVLVAGLLIFGLATWALSSAVAVHPRAPGRTGSGQGAGGGHHSKAHGSAPAGRHARESRAAGHPKRSATGGRADDRRSDLAASEAAKPKTAQPETANPQAARSGPARTAPGQASGQASGHGAILPAFCARKSIVISIFTGQTQFGRRQRPAFDLNVVSTQQAECSFNVGSQHLSLVIKEGPARVWSSSDCAAGTAGLITALGRGVPTVLTVTWNRRTSAPGCSGHLMAVPPGVYTAYATDDGLTSEPVTFRLG